MKPWVKVAIIVAVVLVAVAIIKRYTGPDRSAEPFMIMSQQFDTVPPQSFQVPQPPLMVNDQLTAMPQPMATVPVLTEVATALPAAAPTMVPTFVPMSLPPEAAMGPTGTPVLVSA